MTTDQRIAEFETFPFLSFPFNEGQGATPLSDVIPLLAGMVYYTGLFPHFLYFFDRLVGSLPATEKSPMQSQAKDVAQYLAEAPENRRPTLVQLREACLDILEGYEESMNYGMPGYKKDGTVEVAFASQKNYISFYILKKEVLDKHRHLLEGLNVGKGCIRYPKPEKIDFGLVKRLLTDSFLSDGEIC